jgi:poly-gamma-glutamate synthesis protein (capsule biosynthesis protein)
VSFGRLRGQRLMREPERDDFATVRPLLDAADLRFVNLESTISDQGGETQSPIGKLVFTSPPPTADALRRAGIDIVSLANNHAWDYGEAALRETFERLDAAGIAYVGAGRSRAEAYGPRLVEHQGFKIAFVAVTAIWNQELSPHPGRELVADAELDSLVASIAKARAISGVDKVIVSHHGGYEYVDQPHEGSRALLEAAIDAGADAVIGHHPHVVQRVALRGGKPIFFSLGNLLMRMVTGKPWTGFGMFAKLTLKRGAATEAAVCPYFVYGFDALPIGADPKHRALLAQFRFRFEQLLHAGSLIEPKSAARLGDFGEDGCAPLLAAAPDG